MKTGPFLHSLSMGVAGRAPPPAGPPPASASPSPAALAAAAAPSSSSGSTRKAKVTFEYNAAAGDELTLRVGEIVTFISEESEGWWKAELNGKRGLVPSNFLEEIKDDSGERDLTFSHSPIPLRKSTIY